MCNYCHDDTRQPIPEKGFAWKMFRRDGRSGVVGDSYTYGDGGYVSWREFKYVPGVMSEHRPYFGFCGFETQKEARDTANVWNGGRHKKYNARSIVIVRKIHYQQGVGSCLSKEFDTNVRKFLIFKQFKLVTPIKQKPKKEA